MTLPVLRILLVEDEDWQAQLLAEDLVAAGYAVCGTAATLAEAVDLCQRLSPDMALLDVRLQGSADGITVARELLRHRPMPLIFLTSFPDRETFERARQVGPFAFLAKPYQLATLTYSIELAIQHFGQHYGAGAGPAAEWVLATDGLFVRDNGRFCHVRFAGIRWLEADDSYTHIQGAERKFTLRSSLRELEERLPVREFIRTHRRYVVRADQIQDVDYRQNQVCLRTGDALPLGRSFREELFRRLGYVQ